MKIDKKYYYTEFVISYLNSYKVDGVLVFVLLQFFLYHRQRYRPLKLNLIHHNIISNYF